MFGNTAGRSQRGSRRRALAAILAIGLGLLFAAPSAQAEPATAPPTLKFDPTADTSGTPATRITAELKYDCAGMSGEVLKNAIALKECPTNSEALTDNTTVGNCGAAWIDIFDDVPGDKLGRVVYGMTSYQGPIVYRSLLISYAFTTTDQGIVTGAFSDSGVMLSYTYQAAATATSPLPSALAVIMTGGVTLLTGSGCVIIPPRSFVPIS